MSTVVSERPVTDEAPRPAPGWLKNLAIISGILAFLLFLATPFLPVNQTQSSFTWPQNDSLNSVNAPLISVAPEEFEATVPIAALNMLREGQDMVVGTVPADSPEATDRGLFIRGGDGLDVASLSEVIFTLSGDEVADLDEDAVLEVSATGDGTEVSIPGTAYSESDDEDLRPQVTGIYSEIDDTPENLAALDAAGLSVDVEINSRFTTTPTTVKVLAMWGGVLLTLVALWSLWRLDRGDGRKIPFFNRHWRIFKPLDALVLGILGFWYIFGANTSDDGFITTMARVSEHSGYLANYYRWYGVPESPFGSPYYDLLALLSQFTAASAWLRLPSLIAGVLIWLILSREIIPRFGAQITARRVTHWTAAFVFLAFWLPYNNGTRPEPVVALAALLAWALFERSIATSRLFPAALGTIVATLGLSAGPTGLLAVGAFLVALPYLLRILNRRLRFYEGPRWHSVLAMIAPFLAAGTSILVAVFGDQTLRAVLESTRVRGAVGPALEWYSEYVRYSTLFEQTVDGSLTRRFAMIVMVISVVLIVYALVRRGGVPGAAKGPTVRLLIILGLSVFFLMFTPTKWTHHFGIYAGLAGALGALAGVVLSHIVLKSPRARTFTWAAVLGLLAFTFAGWNGWWYVSSFGVPWWDKTPQFRGVEFATIFLILALLVVAIGVVQSLRHDHRKAQARDADTMGEFNEDNALAPTRINRLASAPIAMASIFIVASSLLSFTKAFIDQYPAYSVGLGNVRSLGGNTCSLANEAMVETDTNDSFLTPVGDVALGESLEAGENNGFHPRGIPDSIVAEDTVAANVGAIGGEGGESGTVAGQTGGETGATDDDAADAPGAAGTTDGETGTVDEQSPEDEAAVGATTDDAVSDTTGGTRATVGVNGAVAQLPFNLDYTRVPVLGSYQQEDLRAVDVTTTWYELPEATETAPLVVVSAAGRIAHHDINGVEQPGETLMLEYGRTRDDGTVERLGEEEMMDIGPTPTWRNLRLPIEELPEEADSVRIVAEDTSLAPDDWLAFTPPRVPELEQMAARVDDNTPALLDWSVALQFPCQRPFDHYAGVTEIPEYRVSPDHPGKSALSGFMDFYGGGSLATTEAVNTSYELPSYTRDDWHRDWGSISIYELRDNSQGVAPDTAEIDTEEIVRSGMWHESEMKIRED